MKSWQVFIFSLIPLALVFIGVVGGSIHGSDSEKEEFPTAAPQPTSSEPRPTPAAGTTVIDIVAENILFDKRSLTATAGQPVVVNMDNRDSGVLHNFSLYTDTSATQSIFVGDLSTGPEQVTYEFEAPAAGTYFFRCDVHPDTMTGSFVSN